MGRDSEIVSTEKRKGFGDCKVERCGRRTYKNKARTARLIYLWFATSCPLTMLILPELASLLLPVPQEDYCLWAAVEQIWQAWVDAAHDLP